MRAPIMSMSALALGYLSTIAASFSTMGSTMGMPVRLADLSPVEVSPQEIVAHLERVGQTALGEQSDITPKDVIEILRLAA